MKRKRFLLGTGVLLFIIGFAINYLAETNQYYMVAGLIMALGCLLTIAAVVLLFLIKKN